MIKGRPCKGIYAANDRTITPFVETSKTLKSDQKPIIVECFQNVRAGRT